MACTTRLLKLMVPVTVRWRRHLVHIMVISLLMLLVEIRHLCRLGPQL